MPAYPESCRVKCRHGFVRNKEIWLSHSDIPPDMRTPDRLPAHRNSGIIALVASATSICASAPIYTNSVSRKRIRVTFFGHKGIQMVGDHHGVPVSVCGFATWHQNVDLPKLMGIGLQTLDDLLHRLLDNEHSVNDQEYRREVFVGSGDLDLRRFLEIAQLARRFKCVFSGDMPVKLHIPIIKTRPLFIGQDIKEMMIDLFFEIDSPAAFRRVIASTKWIKYCPSHADLPICLQSDLIAPLTQQSCATIIEYTHCGNLRKIARPAPLKPQAGILTGTRKLADGGFVIRGLGGRFIQQSQTLLLVGQLLRSG